MEIAARGLSSHYKAVRARLNPKPMPKLAPPVPHTIPAAVILKAPRLKTRMRPISWRFGYYAAQPRMGVMVSEVVAVAAKFCNVEVQEILSPQRAANVTRVRFAAIYVAKKITGRGVSEIGRVMKRDHTSIMHAVDRAEQLIHENDEFRALVENIRNEFAGRY